MPKVSTLKLFNYADEIRYSYAGIGKAKRLLGYDPQYDFAQGLNEAIEWYKANL